MKLQELRRIVREALEDAERPLPPFGISESNFIVQLPFNIPEYHFELTEKTIESSGGRVLVFPSSMKDAFTEKQAQGMKDAGFFDDEMEDMQTYFDVEHGLHTVATDDASLPYDDMGRNPSPGWMKMYYQYYPAGSKSKAQAKKYGTKAKGRYECTGATIWIVFRSLPEAKHFAERLHEAMDISLSSQEFRPLYFKFYPAIKSWYLDF
jgi:hypothetical protein